MAAGPQFGTLFFGESAQHEVKDDGAYDELAEGSKRSHKLQKFDRQVRLWGGHGQMLLESTHVCCLGSGAAASETLKNLVLPNVSEFTIIDDAVVGQRDLGNNFFVSEEYLGRSRAAAVAELLMEMNKDIRCNALAQSADSLVDSNLGFFSKFSVVLVVGNELSLNRRLRLADYCNQAQIPFVFVRSFGLLASLRLQLPEHRIVEDHASVERQNPFDLWLTPQQRAIFPELQQYMDAINMDELVDDMEYTHVPYVVIMVKAFDKLASELGRVPGAGDASKLKDKIRAWAAARVARLKAAGAEGVQPAENFDEAIQFAGRAGLSPLKRFELNRWTDEVYADPAAKNLTADSKKFWILVRAVSDFCAQDNGGFLPCLSSIPDMTATPPRYVGLQKIYEAKAQADLARVAAHTQRVLASLGLPANHISPSEINFFVKNSRNLQVERLSTLSQEMALYQAGQPVSAKQWENIFEEMTGYVDDQDQPKPNPRPIQWYWGLVAADVFFEKYKRYPCFDADAAEVQSTAELMLKTLCANAQKDASALTACPLVTGEIVRYNASEMHAVSALIGGIAAAEILKVILNQFVVCNNTFIYNGNHCAGKQMNL